MKLPMRRVRMSSRSHYGSEQKRQSSQPISIDFQHRLYLISRSLQTSVQRRQRSFFGLLNTATGKHAEQYELPAATSCTVLSSELKLCSERDTRPSISHFATSLPSTAYCSSGISRRILRVTLRCQPHQSADTSTDNAASLRHGFLASHSDKRSGGAAGS